MQTDPTRAGFARLESHAVIAWDFDDTLIGHPASVAMHAYIAANPQQRHLIVTFRAQDEARLWQELADATAHLTAQHFHGARLIDLHLADNVQRLRRLRARRLYAGPLAPAERAYLHWKAMVCAQERASLLIDDRTEDVQPGCDAFGIELLHPDRLLDHSA